MKLFNKKEEINEEEKQEVRLFDENGNEVIIENEKPSFLNWVKKHKKAVIAGLVGTAAVVSYGVVKSHKKKKDDDDFDDDCDDDDDSNTVYLDENHFFDDSDDVKKEETEDNN